MTEELENKGCTVINASGDADVDIVKAAVKASEHQPTTLIGEDTDLFLSSTTSTKLLKCTTSVSHSLCGISSHSLCGFPIYNVTKHRPQSLQESKTQ